MNKSVTTIILLCLYALCGVQAQTIRQHDKFWDGVSLWTVEAIWGGKTVTMTNDADDNLSLEVIDGTRGEYKLTPSSQADDPIIPGTEFGWRVQYIRKDGMNFLAVRNEAGDAVWTMVLTPDNVENCRRQQAKMEYDPIDEQLQNTLFNRQLLSKVPNKGELRLLRNEILARHGYRFQSADLQDYFSEQEWYHAGTDNAAIRLNIIEETNIQLIKSEEASRKPVSAGSLVGEWRWVGKDVPELILVLAAGGNEPLGNGLKISKLCTSRNEEYQNPGLQFDGENILIRKDVRENAYIVLNLKPQGDTLHGSCTMVGLPSKNYDGEITLRRAASQ